MTPADLHDALTKPIYTPTSNGTWKPTKSRPGDGVQGMKVSSETVSLVPKNPCWPADAPVPESHKKDSVVSSASSKGKGKEKAVMNSTEPEEDSDSSTFLDANCQPLTKSTSHVSRFSNYGVHAPSYGSLPGPKEWWTEKPRRFSSTSFVSPNSRRASLGTAGYAPTEDVLERAPLICKKCFPLPPKGVEVRNGLKTRVGIAVANAMFPIVGLALVWWSYVNPEMEDMLVLSLVPFSLWMIFLTVIITLWRPAPKPKCTCVQFTGRRASSALVDLERARRNLNEIERWRWERRRGSKASRGSVV